VVNRSGSCDARDAIDRRDEPHPAHDARQMMAASDQDSEFQLDVGAEFGDRPGVVVFGSTVHV
jgi:hypothetical protein